jgi:mevalonate kinase
MIRIESPEAQIDRPGMIKMVEGESTGFGHGKVILMGEHAVVHGQAALAAGIAAGVRARARPGDGSISVPAWGIEARTGDGSELGTAVARILGRLGVPARLDFVLDAAIPTRAGLGSSAAMAVAIARAAAATSGDGTGTRACASDEDIGAAVADSEAVFHGSPSGIDAAAAMSGAMGEFTRGKGWRRLDVRLPIDVCVGLSGKPRDTRTQVEAVARLCARTPAAHRLIETLGQLTVAACDAIAREDIDTLGRLFDMGHGVLAGLGVSSAVLDEMVHAARGAGAIGAKLTGAGGGGAVIALAPAHERGVIERWRSIGYDGFVTKLGAGPA